MHGVLDSNTFRDTLPQKGAMRVPINLYLQVAVMDVAAMRSVVSGSNVNLSFR